MCQLAEVIEYALFIITNILMMDVLLAVIIGSCTRSLNFCKVQSDQLCVYYTLSKYSLLLSISFVLCAYS